MASSQSRPSSLNSGSHLSDALIATFDEQEKCDVMFEAEGKIIKAHQLVLYTRRSRCECLYQMANGWKSGDDPISVNDLDYESLKSLLR